MIQTNVREEYNKAQRLGQKECRELTAAGTEPYPQVLEEILPDLSRYTLQDLPPVEIPVDRIVGTRAAGRVSAFSASFYPLLEADSEFAAKWMRLCEAHLSDTGIRDPIECYEYLGSFYVQEGNKRVSVLRYFGAAQIPGRVKRVLPTVTDDPRIQAYYEFLDFYKVSRLYDVQFKKPGSYARLLAALGKQPGEPWSDAERSSFAAGFHYFKQAFLSLGGVEKGLSVEEALLVWLQVYPHRQLRELSPKELKATLSGLWGDVQASSAGSSVRTEPETEHKTILDRLIPGAPKHLNAAFVYMRDPEVSPWARGHARGAAHLAETMAGQVTVREYFGADTPEKTEELLDRAVEEGADVLFTTAPPLLRPTLKAAVKYPRVRFLNCSTGTQLSSVRSYYCRTYEGKFVTGMIAGAMAENDRIGYVGSYPILGVPAAINAFALGAQMTNPRAKIMLEWSCLPGDPVSTLLERGARVISNRDIPLNDHQYMEQGQYGTFLVDDTGAYVPLASPCWMWGKLYEAVVRTVLSGSWNQKKDGPEAINYWWGMDSGVMDVELTDHIPQGVLVLVEAVMSQLREGHLDPFLRPICTQNGTPVSDGSRTLDAMEVLHMDWLCENVEGYIPKYEELLPMSRALVRELGVYRENIPPERERDQT